MEIMTNLVALMSVIVSLATVIRGANGACLEAV
jgi:hypothetical protein